MDVAYLIPGSSVFSKYSLHIWKITVHILLKPVLENFEHYFASVWNECNCVIVWAFFGIAFLWDWNENWPFPVLWPLLDDTGLIPGLGRSPGRGHGNPFQYSCLENAKDRGAWLAIVHGVTKCRTWLKWLRTHNLYYLFFILHFKIYAFCISYYFFLFTYYFTNSFYMMLSCFNCIWWFWDLQSVSLYLALYCFCGLLLTSLVLYPAFLCSGNCISNICENNLRPRILVSSMRGFMCSTRCLQALPIQDLLKLWSRIGISWTIHMTENWAISQWSTSLTGLPLLWGCSP